MPHFSSTQTAKSALVGQARAHTNIALIKYWGKKDPDLFLPMVSSLSLTLSGFYTDTRVSFSEQFSENRLLINGEEQSGQAKASLDRFMSVVARRMDHPLPVCVESYNHVPTAAGLASSASAYAALTGAIADALSWPIDRTELSRLARRGSGSATRSLFGGFVEWEKGVDDSSSRALPIDDGAWDVGMLAVILNDQEKKVSSRQGMAHTVATSPFYPAFVASQSADLAAMKAAIRAHDLVTMGKIAEHNAMKMHATTLSAKPPMTYFSPDSLRLIQAVQDLLSAGYSCYYTMDAGPNVKILSPKSQQEDLKKELQRLFPSVRLVTSQAGPAMRCLSCEEWQELYPQPAAINR